MFCLTFEAGCCLTVEPRWGLVGMQLCDAGFGRRRRPPLLSPETDRGVPSLVPIEFAADSED